MKTFISALVLGLALTACGTVATEGEFGTPQVTGGPLPALAQDGTDPSVGTEIPAVSGTDFSGTSVTIDPASGEPKVILFLAHWCPHCQDEVPAVQAFFDEQGGLPEGVEFISVATSSDPTRPNFPPSAWLEGEGWEPPVIVDDEDRTVANAFGLSAFPFWVIVGPDGQVIQRVAGGVNIEALGGLFDQLTSLESSTR